MKQYETLMADLDRAHNEYAHAKQHIEDQVGERLRRCQAVAIAVIEKCNGRTIADQDRHDFNMGSGTWAVKLAQGFTVEQLHSTHIVVRALVTPTVQQRPVTYRLDLDWLARSDRAVASMLRKEIRALKLADKHYQQREAAKTLRQLQRQIVKQRALLDSLESQSEDLTRQVERVKS